MGLGQQGAGDQAGLLGFFQQALCLVSVCAGRHRQLGVDSERREPGNPLYPLQYTLGGAFEVGPLELGSPGNRPERQYEAVGDSANQQGLGRPLVTRAAEFGRWGGDKLRQVVRLEHDIAGGLGAGADVVVMR